MKSWQTRLRTCQIVQITHEERPVRFTGQVRECEITVVAKGVVEARMGLRPVPEIAALLNLDVVVFGASVAKIE
jgi:hypothetical protein